MVRITEEDKVHKTSLFYDNGVYRFALKVSHLDPSLVNDFINDTQKVIYDCGGRGIKTRKSKDKVNFGFTADNGGIAEQCYKYCLTNYEQWLIGHPKLKPQAQPSQDPTPTSTKTYPFKEGDELILIDNPSQGVRNKIQKIGDENVIIDGLRYNIDIFDKIIQSNLVLPEVKYEIKDGDYYYDEKNNLCKLRVFPLGVEKEFYEDHVVSQKVLLESKYYTPKWFSYMIETGRWKKLTINLYDVFGFKLLYDNYRYEITNKYVYSSGDEYEIKTIVSNTTTGADATSYNVLNENATKYFFWINNAPKLVDSEANIKKYEETKNLNDLERKVIDLKDELKNLVQLREVIDDVDFEDRFNVNSMIKDTQKEIDKTNAELLEQKIGSDKFFDALFEQSFKPLANRYDTNLEKNKNETLLAPNGEMSDLPLELHKVIRSQDFIEWFGDWRSAYMYRSLPDLGGENVSKAVSEKFEPLLVWHGTNSEFSSFRFDNFPANYFAVNRQYSEFFATARAEDGVGYVLPFFINVKNPLDLTLFANDKVSSQEFFDWIYLQTGKTPQDLEVEEIFLDPTTPPLPVWVFIRNNPKMLVNIATKTNFDSIVFDEFNPNIGDVNNPAYSTRAYIIFDPHQVKLADPERGDILLTELKSFILKRGGKI